MFVKFTKNGKSVTKRDFATLTKFMFSNTCTK